LIFITQLLFRLDLEGISKSGQNPVKDWLEKPFFKTKYAAALSWVAALGGLAVVLIVAPWCAAVAGRAWRWRYYQPPWLRKVGASHCCR
jgi:hypothetical protein